MLFKTAESSGFLVFLVFAFSCALPRQERYDVVIVGAGVAGIAASQELLKNNISNILILEARERIGGRIHTVEFGNETIDLGAQYVYAFEGNSVYDLSHDLDLFYTASHRHADVVSKDGYSLHKSVVNDIMNLDVKMEKRDYSSFDEHWLPRMRKYMVVNGIPLVDALLYLDTAKKLFSIHHGADTDQVSAWGVSKYREKSHGHSEMWKNGFQTFLNILMGEEGNKTENLGLREKILLNKVVTNIIWSDKGAQVSCSDGSTYMTDRVISTLPLGIMKNLPEDFFDPPLPEEKTKVIENLGNGFVDKIFILYNDEITSNRNVLFATNSTMDADFIVEHNKGIWPTKLTGACPTRDSAKLLNSWLVGEDATKAMESLPLLQVKDGVLAVMRTLLTIKVPKPKAILRSKWATDPFSQGSYSFRSVETEKYNVSHGQLARPLLDSNKNPIVLFAGEATSDSHYGTVHGAMESGQAAARTIINLK